MTLTADVANVQGLGSAVVSDCVRPWSGQFCKGWGLLW